MAQASKKEVEDNAQMEMDLLLNETKDPVSGNTAPVGALPSEVRDDIDIRVSENEYVIPAYAVRYFGEDFFDELLGSAKEGWERIKEGDELPFRDDELEVESDDDDADEELKEGYAEGGNIPGTEVPKPVGGGYGRYGGTGAVYTGFESRTFVDPDTDREIIIFFFNGRPMSRIPEGYRPKGETVVEEQQQVQRERDDDDDDDISLESIGISDKTWRNTAVSDWTNKDYKDYNEDLASKIRKGEDPLGLNIVEKGILSVVGGLIAGPAGSIGLPMLAKKAKQKQAEAAHTQAINLMQSSSDKDIISAADATRYITGSALQKEGYAVNVADPFSGFAKKDDDRNIFDRLFGRQGDLDLVTGMPTAEAVRQRNLAQYGSETSNYMLDPFKPPSPAVGETIAGIETTPTPVTTPAPRDEKSTRLDATNPNTSANVAEHLSDREKESLRANPELAGHYVATANRRANEAAAGDSSNTDNAKERSDAGGCFLTTAIVDRRGEADDGPTLTKLRNFRDTYLVNVPNEVEEYYNVAPKIVEAIPLDHEEWDWVGSQIDKSVEFIDEGSLDDAYKTYKAMVNKLKKDWL